MDFDPIAAGEAAKHDLKLLKARNYKKRTSKLEPWRHEIAKLYQAKYSLEHIQNHLYRVHYLTVARSTILRYLHSICVTHHG